MSQANGTQENQKAAKIRRKPDHESVLQPTFAAARHITGNNLWSRNQEGSGLLQRRCACGTHTIAGGACDACRKKRESDSWRGSALDVVTGDAFLNDPVEPHHFPKSGFTQDFSQIPAHTTGPRSSVQANFTSGPKLTHGIQPGKQSHHSEVINKSPLQEPENEPPPADMSCPPSRSTPQGTTYSDINFSRASSALSPAQIGYLEGLVQNWDASGQNSTIRIDGFASAEGTADYNWRLSCDRAMAVAHELINPSNGSTGIPRNMVEFFANGETNSFSSTDYGPNRIARITVDFAASPQPESEESEPESEERDEDQPKCGPDITSTLSSVLATVAPYFNGLTSFQKWRSCMALIPAGPAVGVNPVMAWDIRDLFLPNTGVLDPYFSRHGCGSPRNSRCSSDPTRRACETPATTCGNSVLVGGKCMLAGTANYALWGKLCKLCNDEFEDSVFTNSFYFSRAGLQVLIRVWKAVDGDDPNPPITMALSVYDGAFPTVAAGAENRSHCTGRCRSYAGSFTFIWEPYRPR